MLRNKKWQEQYDYIDSLTETGNYHTVGIGMINNLHEAIREAYKAGFADGKKISNQGMQARKFNANRRVLRSRKP